MAVTLNKRPSGNDLTLANDLRLEFSTDEQFEYPYYVRFAVQNAPASGEFPRNITLLNTEVELRASGGNNDASGFVGDGTDTIAIASNLLAHLQARTDIYSPDLLRVVPGVNNQVEVAWSEDRWTSGGEVGFLTNAFIGTQIEEIFLGANRRQVFLDFFLEYGGQNIRSPQTVDQSVLGPFTDLLVSDGPENPAGAYGIGLGSVNYTLGDTPDQHIVTIEVVGPGSQVLYSENALIGPNTAPPTESDQQSCETGSILLTTTPVQVTTITLDQEADVILFGFSTQFTVPDWTSGSWGSALVVTFTVDGSPVKQVTTSVITDSGPPLDVDITGQLVEFAPALPVGEVIGVSVSIPNDPPGNADNPTILGTSGSPSCLTITSQKNQAATPIQGVMAFGTPTIQHPGGQLFVRMQNPDAPLGGVLAWNMTEFTLFPQFAVGESVKSKVYTFPFSSDSSTSGKLTIDPRQMIQDLMFLNFPALIILQSEFWSPEGYIPLKIAYTERYLDDVGTIVTTSYGDGPDYDVERPFTPFNVIRSVMPLFGNVADIFLSDELGDGLSLTIPAGENKWVTFPDFEGRAEKVLVKSMVPGQRIPLTWTNVTELTNTMTIGRGTLSNLASPVDPTFRLRPITFKHLVPGQGGKIVQLRIVVDSDIVYTSDTITLEGDAQTSLSPELVFTVQGDVERDEIEIQILTDGSTHPFSVNGPSTLDEFDAERTKTFTISNFNLNPHGLIHYPIGSFFLFAIWNNFFPDATLESFSPFTFTVLDGNDQPISKDLLISYSDSGDCYDNTVVWQGLRGNWESISFERVERTDLEISGDEVEFYKHESRKWTNTFSGDTPGTVSRIASARDTVTLRSRRMPNSMIPLYRSLLLSPVHYFNEPGTEFHQVYITREDVTLLQYGEVFRLQIEFKDTDKILTQQ